MWWKHSELRWYGHHCEDVQREDGHWYDGKDSAADLQSVGDVRPIPLVTRANALQFEQNDRQSRHEHRATVKDYSRHFPNHDEILIDICQGRLDRLYNL